MSSWFWLVIDGFYVVEKTLTSDHGLKTSSVVSVHIPSQESTEDEAPSTVSLQEESESTAPVFFPESAATEAEVVYDDVPTEMIQKTENCESGLSGWQLHAADHW